jgi:DNA-binding NtrC family response regulator
MLCDAPSPLIVIVDDDALVGLSLARLLETLGFRSRYFHSGEEFLDSLSPASPDCILLDVCMPGISGPQVVQELQQRRITAPVIYISGDAEICLSQSVEVVDSRSILNKPFCVDDLFIKVNNALGCRGFVPQRCPWPCPIIGHSVWNCAMSGYSEAERELLNAQMINPTTHFIEQDRHTPLLAL